MTNASSNLVQVTDRDTPLSVPQIENLEWQRRAKAAEFAQIDALLGTKAVVAAGVMERYQTEGQNPQNYTQTDIDLSYPAKFFYEDLPNLPLDWKAIAPAAAAYVAVNVLARARDYQNFGTELRHARRAAAGAEGFVPHTEKSLKRYQRKLRVKRAAASIVSMGAAYKMGTQLDTVQNFVAGAGILGTGLLTHTVKNSRINRTAATSRRR